MTITDLSTPVANQAIEALIQALRATGINVTLPCTKDPELWFSEDVEDVAHAKAECRSCLVRRPCLLRAEEAREPWGVWGGELFSRGTIVATKSTSRRKLARAVRADELLFVIRALSSNTEGQITVTTRNLRLSWNKTTTTNVTYRHLSDALADLIRKDAISVAGSGNEKLTISLTRSSAKADLKAV